MSIFRSPSLCSRKILTPGSSSLCTKGVAKGGRLGLIKGKVEGKKRKRKGMISLLEGQEVSLSMKSCVEINIKSGGASQKIGVRTGACKLDLGLLQIPGFGKFHEMLFRAV